MDYFYVSCYFDLDSDLIVTGTCGRFETYNEAFNFAEAYINNIKQYTGITDQQIRKILKYEISEG